VSPIHLVVAVAENGVIGAGGALPWRLPAELAHFRALTMGHPIVMGRRTQTSIGRPLPGRRNIVLSRRAGFVAEGCTVVPSLDAALALAEPGRPLMVIGGASLYREALPRAERVHLTEVHAEVEGDVYLEGLARADWLELSRARHRADARNEHDYSFVELARREGTE